MYMLIGHELDTCCQWVASILRERGHDVLLTSDPLAEEIAFTWALESDRSESHLRLSGRPAIPAAALHGVLVRARGGPVSPEGWDPVDFAYVQAESQAALLAWLWKLPCPVVNRLSADLWFRPYRSLLDWHAAFSHCGLPTLTAQVTNDLAQARRFADRWGGSVTYMPVTSATRYPISDATHWSELAKVLLRVPVCLTEPIVGPAGFGCLTGSEVVWTDDLNLSGAMRTALEDGLRRLADLLGVATLQVQVVQGRDGPRCLSIDLIPQLEWYAVASQSAIVANLIQLLGAAT